MLYDELTEVINYLTEKNWEFTDINVLCKTPLMYILTFSNTNKKKVHIILQDFTDKVNYNYVTDLHTYLVTTKKKEFYEYLQNAN